MGRWGARGRYLAAAVASLLVALEARAEGLSLYLEPIFTMSHVETQDQLGNGTEQDVRALTQNYRLNFDRTISPAFSVSAGRALRGAPDLEHRRDPARAPSTPACAVSTRASPWACRS